MRVKRGVKARRRRTKILKLAKGFRGRSSTTIRQAKGRIDKAQSYAYRDRRNKKRDFRRLWIARIGAAARGEELSYSGFMCGLKAAGIELDRKILSDLGAEHPDAFSAVAAVAKESLSKSAVNA